MSKFKDLMGKKFGRLLVIEFIETKKNDSFWKCKCDCGTIKVIRRSSLGRTTHSCGCLRSELTSIRGKLNKGGGLPFGVASKNKLFDKYKRGAKARNFCFELTLKQFELLTKQDCYYCGVEPRQVTKDKGSNGYYTYNGIDRVDNKDGYVLGNVVTCCEKCNRAKLQMSQKEFYSWIARAYEHLGLSSYDH